MSDPHEFEPQPAPDPRPTCARTDAVLAVHLDGDLEQERFDREACEPLGYGFISDDSLHSHLRECAICQTALHRARRLDAALASMSGRAVSEQVAKTGLSMDELGDQWLQCAALAASESTGAGRTDEADWNGDQEEDVVRSEDSVGSEDVVRSEDLDWLFDRAIRESQQTDAHADGARKPSRTGTWIALAGTLAACLATWLCISHFHEASGSGGDGEALASAAVGEPSAPDPRVGSGLLAGQVAIPAMIAAQHRAAVLAHDALEARRELAPTTENPVATRRWSLARSMHAARNRDLIEQRTLTAADLSQRVGDRNLDAAERLDAAQRLLRATRAGSTAARHATDHVLLALAGCGDLDRREVALHQELLDEVRSNGSVLVRLEHRLASLPTRNRDRSELSQQALAAIVVAARVENDRLDQGLRRALRRNDAIADVVAAALRCGVRQQGTTQLLLDCWHDQVAIGKQQNTDRWAEFWFRGQADETFAELARVHQSSHSSQERIRCLLAMGCVHDDSTVKPLLAGLVAPRRLEACAAAIGIASLPHRVLKNLLPKAKAQEAGLLRAALARAGMPHAKRWLQTLALSKPQLELMRRGPITRFSEVAAWFRKSALTAD